MLKQLTAGLVYLLCLSACNLGTTTNIGQGDGAVSPTTSGPPETAPCTAPTSYGTAVTITGHASYISRIYFGDENSGGLGSANPSDATHPALVNPIRYAEIQIKNASGFTVQCAQTDGSGDFSFALPQTNSSFTVLINSRSFPAPALSGTTHLYASVLDQPASNQYYSLTRTVNASISTNIGTLTAAANGDLLGGAFNIYDQLLRQMIISWHA